MSLIKKPLNLFGLILLLVLGACASTPKELELFDRTMRNYEKAMIWGEYGYVVSAHKNSSLSQLQQQRLESIKVTAFDVLRSRVSKDKSKAFQTVELRYYNRAYAIVKSIKVEYEWLYDKNEEQWVVLTPFPDFK